MAIKAEHYLMVLSSPGFNDELRKYLIDSGYSNEEISQILSRCNVMIPVLKNIIKKKKESK